MDAIIAEFLDEAEEMNGQLEAALARLGETPGDPVAMEQAFRSVHTIKGASGFLGFTRLETLTTAGELLLGRLAEGRLELTPFRSTVLADLHEVLQGLLSRMQGDRAEPAGDDRDLLARLEVAAGQS